MKKKNIYIILGVILIILGVYFIYFKYLKSINVTGVSSKTCDYKPKLYYEKDNRKIYSYCLDNIEIKSGNSYLELSKYLENHLIEDFVNLLSEGSSYDDGGSTIYRDGGTKKITKNNLNILVCHTEGNRDIYIGNKEMYYKSNFCKSDNTTTTYRYKVLNIDKYTKDQYTSDGTKVSYSNSYLAKILDKNGSKTDVILNNINLVPVKNNTYDFEFIMPKDEKINDTESLFKKANLIEIRKVK